MYSEHVDSICKILQLAEEEILKIVSLGAEAGDYRTIRTAENIATRVRSIHEQLQADSKERERKKSPSSVSGELPAIASRLSDDKSDSYPKFRVEHMTLKRVGWLKKKEKEYVHNVSRETFDLVVNAMHQLAVASPGPVYTDDIEQYLKRMDALPLGYELYAVLAFLVFTEVVQKSSRGVFKVSEDIVQLADQAWRIAEREQ